MYLAIPPQRTRAKAWMAAVKSLQPRGDYEANNVVIDVEEPLRVDADDSEVERLVDVYLREHREHGCMPLRSVANTIFPTSLYRRHGYPEFFQVYTDTVFPRLRRPGNDWGRYFDRLTAFKPANTPLINPLADLVMRMRDNVQGERTYRNIYELNIYDPARDARSLRGRQCLSFLSFKLDTEHRVCLTAIYRNHAYTTRLLGNMIGLGELMNFVAEQVGAKLGALTIISTHAEIDSPGKRSTLDGLHAACAAVFAKPLPSAREAEVLA